jgi:hypothetical protein
MVALIQCTMLSTESTKDYVTRLWGHVKRLTDLPTELHKRLILVMLRLAHACPPVCDLLMEKQPATIQAAEKICEEYETRQQQKPVAAKFVKAMASAGASAPVDNIQTRGGYRGPKNHGQRQSRGVGGSNTNNGGVQGQQRQANDPPSTSAGCYRCGRPGHIARYCQAPAHAIISSPAGTSGFNPGSRGRGQHQARNQQRSVSNVGTQPPDSDYAASQEQMQYPGRNLSYLPEFQHHDAAEVAYSMAYTDKVAEVLPSTSTSRMTYGPGSPHRNAHVYDAPATVHASCANYDWWTPIHFPTCDYLVNP